MIEINLLPGAKRKRGGKGGGFKLPDVKQLAASVKDPWLIGAVAGWALVALALAFLYVPRRNAVRALEPQLEAKQREASRLQAVLASKAETEAKRDSLLRQIDVIRNIDRERYVWPHILDAVTQALPPYTWLDEISGRTAESGDSTAGSTVNVVLTGKSADIQAITRFVRNLEESPFLQTSNLVSTGLINEQNRQVFSYVINVSYQRPDTTILTMQPMAASLVQGYRSGAARPR